MNEDGYSPRQEAGAPPPLNRTLHLDLQPAARLTWIGAGWATLCGIASAGIPDLNVDTAARVLLTLVLADLVLGAVWNRLLEAREFAQRVAEPEVEHSPAAPSSDGRPSSEPGSIKAASSAEVQSVEQQPRTGEELDLESTPASFWASIAAGLGGGRRPEAFDELETGSAAGPGTPPGIARRWWKALNVAYRQHVAGVGLLYGLALLLALILGPGAAITVGLGLIFPLIAWFALGGYPLRDDWTRAVVEVGFPWAVGLAAFTAWPATRLGNLSGVALATVRWAGAHLPALGIGLLFVVAYYGELSLLRSIPDVRHRALLNLPQVVIVLFLVAWRQPLLAGAAAVLVMAQMLFQPYLGRHRARWYMRSTQWMFMGVMLVAAIGLAVK